MEFKWHVHGPQPSIWAEIGDETIYVVEILDIPSIWPFKIKNGLAELVSRAFSHFSENNKEHVTQIVFELDPVYSSFTVTYTDAKRIVESPYVQKMNLNGVDNLLTGKGGEQRSLLATRVLSNIIGRWLKNAAARQLATLSHISNSGIMVMYTIKDSDNYERII